MDKILLHFSWLKHRTQKDVMHINLVHGILFVVEENIPVSAIYIYTNDILNYTYIDVYKVTSLDILAALSQGPAKP